MDQQQITAAETGKDVNVSATTVNEEKEAKD